MARTGLIQQGLDWVSVYKFLLVVDLVDILGMSWVR
jgi:hypothetical protein